jgi:hypothetical protein
MVRQRERLRLLEADRWHVPARFELVPVLAVGLPVPSPQVDERMGIVYGALDAEAPQLVSGLRVWTVDRDGEVSEGG